ncbi:MAG: TiaS agmantine-binding domain-containing protein [Candidatus Njordarchaeia archaeon]
MEDPFVCPLCGRPKNPEEKFCEICQYTLCRKCGKRLARGYCSICGELVCDDDSRMVGYARVCNECLKKDPRLSDFDYLKKKVASLSAPVTVERETIEVVFEAGRKEFDSGNIFYFVGIDDTDSPFGMCTTYLGFKIVESLSRFVDFHDYPLLVRLNPNVPMKTRGNASVCIPFSGDIKDWNRVLSTIKDVFEKFSHFSFLKTNPTLSLYVNRKNVVDPVFTSIYWDAVRDVLTPRIVLKKLEKLREGFLVILSNKSKPRGIVGSVAAIGADFKDFTYELLAYRSPENYGKERVIDKHSVYKMDKAFSDYTFNNVDGKRILIAPTGPDPVLFGIRGDLPDKLLKAFKILEHEEIEGWIIYRTNQGTGVHIRDIKQLDEARPYQTIRYVFIVESVDSMGEKRTIYSRADDWKVLIHLYKPHGYLRGVVDLLKSGDVIEVAGSVLSRENNVMELNLEELTVKYLQPKEITRSPLCPNCGARMKKKSANEYYCKKCGFRIRYGHKITILSPRNEIEIEIGKRFLPPPKAHRHLTLPNKRVRYRELKLEGKIENVFVKPFFGKGKVLTPNI